MATRAKKKESGRSDFVAHGSERHAQLLRLRKATKEDDESLIFEGWTLQDFTEYGPNATDKYLKAILMQRVRELNAKPTVPTNAPEMFDPESFRLQSTTQTEIDEAIQTLKRAGLV